MADHQIPETQVAVQLTGADQLELNTSKPVPRPGPYQVLAEVEAVGLCFSDMKLLHSFTSHPRKGPIIKGIDPEILKEIPSYVPDELPTVPGHEVCVRIIEVGDQVTHYKVGDRYLVQADYRHLLTADNNAAFGYNFEGALQQYTLLDERVNIGPDGESFLVPVTEEPGASSIALVEPWACVEDSYCREERTRIKDGGRMLVVGDATSTAPALIELAGLLVEDHRPSEITLVGMDSSTAASLKSATSQLGVNLETVDSLQLTEANFYDDVVYFGASKVTVETLDRKLAEGGLLNIVTGGKSFGDTVMIDVGRVHYAHTRIVGTTSNDPGAAYQHIPHVGELRTGDSMMVIGAGGPMGTMHVIRSLSMMNGPSRVIGSDVSDERLQALAQRAATVSEGKSVEFIMHNPKAQGALQEQVDYVALLAPVPALVSASVKQLGDGGILNLFAGIKSGTQAEIDLDHYIENRLYMFGTSGSTVADLYAVLDKVSRGELETNASVAVISGMKGAIEGLEGVNEQRFQGKVIVYPWLPDLGLVQLTDLASVMPEVAAQLKDGMWTKEAEKKLQESK